MEAFRESLRRRPASASTYRSLGQALREIGLTQQADEAWEESLRLDGGHLAVEAISAV